MKSLVAAHAGLEDYDARFSKRAFATFKRRFMGGTLWPFITTLPQHQPSLSSPSSPLSRLSTSSFADSEGALSFQSSNYCSAASAPDPSSIEAGPSFPGSSTSGTGPSFTHRHPSASRRKPRSKQTTSSSTASYISHGSKKYLDNGAPTPLFMFPSFSLEEPAKKPRPLPLDPKKMHRMSARHGEKQKQSTPGSWIAREFWQRDSHFSTGESSLYPSTTTSRILASAIGDELSTYSSISSFRAGSPTDSANPHLHWQSDIDIDSLWLRENKRSSLSCGPEGTQELEPDGPEEEEEADESETCTPTKFESERPGDWTRQKLTRIL